MNAMIRRFHDPESALLDHDARETPFRLSSDDFYAETGDRRRVDLRPVDDREDDR